MHELTSQTNCLITHHLNYVKTGLTHHIDVSMGVELGDIYYPLAGNKGERFPYNDPTMTAVLEPVPATRGKHACLYNTSTIDTALLHAGTDCLAVPAITVQQCV
jgi:hypothetical protein